MTDTENTIFKPLPQAHNFIDLTGRQFGRLTVLGYLGKTAPRRREWLCQCSCGNRKITTTKGLVGKHTQSCGCLKREADGQNLSWNKGRTQHGMCYTKEHAAWRGMLGRCYRVTHQRYSLYGGRGIAVCDRWRESFVNFYTDMGTRPSPKHSLDRIDNDGNYTPENCRWATQTEQTNNRRNNVMYTFQGKTQSLALWSRELNIKPHTLRSRLRHWSVEKAFTTPAQIYRKSS